MEAKMPSPSYVSYHRERSPAVALTAYVRDADRAHIFKAGYDMFMPKPVELVELPARLASLVSTES